MDPLEAVKINYQYIFFHEDGTAVVEWNDRKQIDISKSGVDEIQVFDTWCDTGSYENTFYTDPFQEVLLDENRTHFKLKSPKTFTHIFKVKAPLLKKNEILCLLGESPQPWETGMESRLFHWPVKTDGGVLKLACRITAAPFRINTEYITLKINRSSV